MCVLQEFPLSPSALYLNISLEPGDVYGIFMIKHRSYPLLPGSQTENSRAYKTEITCTELRATGWLLSSIVVVSKTPAYSFQNRRHLYKKADEVGLSQPTPSFSRGLNPPPRKVSTPPGGCSVSDRFDVAVLPRYLPSPCRQTRCPKSPIREQ